MNTTNADRKVPEWLAMVRCRVAGMQFGVVQIIVHEGQVVQIECTEKTRLPKPGPDRRPSGSLSYSL